MTNSRGSHQLEMQRDTERLTTAAVAAIRNAPPGLLSNYDVVRFNLLRDTYTITVDCSIDGEIQTVTTLEFGSVPTGTHT